MFSPTFFVWLGLCLALFLFALLLGNVGLLAGGVFLLLFVLLGSLLAPPTRISIDRRLSRRVCWAGDIVEVRRELEVGGGMGALTVHDELPGHVQVVSGSNFRVVWKWPRPRRYDLSYQLLCPKRGTLSLEPTQWQTQSALGMHRHGNGSAGPVLEMSIVPRLLNIGRLNEARSIATRVSANADVARVGASTTDFVDIRPYSPGDTIRSINWKASARSLASKQELLVNRYQPEGRMAVWVFLDGANYMDVGTSLFSPIEHAIEAVGALAWYHLIRGYTLGAYMYNCPSSMVPPDLGRKQFNRLAKVLSALRTGPPTEGLLEAVERCKGFLYRLQPDVFVITRLDAHYPRLGQSREALDSLTSGIRRLTSLKSQSNRAGRVHVVQVGIQEYLPMETSLADQTMSLIGWEAQPLSGLLRRAGASVLEWNPVQEEFASALLREISTPR